MAKTATPVTKWVESPQPWHQAYPEGVPTTIDYPVMPLFQFLDEAAANYPDSPAMIFFDKKTSYRDLAEKVGRLATALHDLGVRKGDPVAIFLPNCPQFVISYFAIMKLGAIVVAFNIQYLEQELAYQLSDSGAKTVICLDFKLYGRIKRIRDQVGLESVIVTSLSDEMPTSKRIIGKLIGKVAWSKNIDSEDYFFDDLIANHQNNPPKVEIDPMKDLALIQYTGGTTGVSKGAMLTHYNLASNALVMDYWIKPRTKKGKESYICVLPFFHVYGQIVCMVSAVAQAASLIIIPDPRAGNPPFQDLLETLAKNKPTFFHGVPTLYMALLYHPDIKDYDLTSIRACLSGAAPLPVEVMLNFEELTGANVVEGYGLTETSPLTHANPIAPDGIKKPGSIGLPVPDTMAKIFSIEDGETELPIDEEGEIGLKGPQVFPGYWNMPEETANVFNSQGYFLTGDIGKMDSDGYFWITDRKKDMINVGGLKVFPRDVEDIIYEHPAILETAVVGIPDSYRGETVKAFCVLQDGETASEDEIIEFCKGRMARFKVPKFVDFPDELPKSAIGKILRRELRDEEIEKAKKKGK